MFKKIYKIIYEFIKLKHNASYIVLDISTFRISMYEMCLKMLSLNFIMRISTE